MTLDDYQNAALETAKYGDQNALEYTILGLVGEAGEIANKYKKVLRDDGGILSETKRVELGAEIGDVLWYVAALSKELGFPLDNIAIDNIAKLRSRRERGVISGSGDNR